MGEYADDAIDAGIDTWGKTEVRQRLPKKNHDMPNCESCGGRQLVPARSASFARIWRKCSACKGTGNKQK
jgi:DnaJ-class molecular chaperone